MNTMYKNGILRIEVKDLFAKTIQEFMDLYFPSKKIQHLLITNGWLKMDEMKVKRETPLDGKYLTLELYPEKNSYRKLEKDNVEILYEDELLCVVNKPAGIIVHSDKEDEVTLSTLVRSHYASEPYLTLNPIHRLDKETSGLVFFSKSPLFQPLFDHMLLKREIKRTYLAFAKGKAEKGVKMTFDDPIGKDRHNAGKMIVYKNGQDALTKVESLGYKNGITTFRCTLLTGRTHQIRVHLSSHHYPIINDPLYGVPENSLDKMGLVAYELQFYHPFREENVKVKLELEPKMKALML